MKVFKVTQLNLPHDKDQWITGRDIEDCLRNDNCSIGKSIGLKIEEGEDDKEEVTDELVYTKLLRKVYNETDADSCSCWASALEKFCGAIRTKAGG